MPTNYEYCAALVREADRDRYLATLFAPAAQRDALYALYAFNVEIGRVRDLAREPMPGEIRLQWWREALSGEREGEAAAHPVAAALRETLARHGFVATPLLELIDAHSFDLYDEPMATLGELELYAIRTQSPLFAIAAGILGSGTAPPDTFTLDASVMWRDDSYTCRWRRWTAIRSGLRKFSPARRAGHCLPRLPRCANWRAGTSRRREQN